MSSPKRVLVTGSQGFIGARLVSALRENGIEAPGPELDLFDFASVERAVSAQNWEAIVHLAAISHVPSCEQDPEKAYRTNVNGTALLLESIRKHRPGVHLVFASTAQVYAGPGVANIGSSTAGEISSTLLEDKRDSWDETRAVQPQNLYARTKRAAEVLVEESSFRGECTATILRLFNHTHHAQSPDFFLPHIYSVLKHAAPGQNLMVPVGNLDLYRDIGSIQDLIVALVAALHLKKGSACEVFNIASGAPKHLRTLAQLLARQLKISAEFKTDPSRVRPGEPRWIQGSHEKFSARTGWRPACRSEEDLVAAFLG